MRQVKVLYLPQEGVDPLWDQLVVEMVRGRHDLTVFDKTKPLSPQFENVEVVIEMGGFASARDIPDTSTDVRLWQLLSTGLDHVDTEDLKSKGFTVTYCPGPLSAVALAESAIMLMLMLARRFNEARQQFDAAIMYALMGEELSSKTLAIVGFGASGQQLALRAKAFGMRVRAVDVRHIDQTIVDEIQPEFLGGPDDLDDLLCECDYLAVHVPLIDETRHLIDARRIGLLKSTASIINVARGAVIDEEAMHDALLTGRIAGAGLDVFGTEPPDPTLPVYQLPNVVVTPHVAGETTGVAHRRVQSCADNVDRVARGEEPMYQV